MNTFTHLHVHTQFSLLDGASRIPELVKKVKELGMDALAITDHGAMYGVVDFYEACRKEGIRPIIGMETYVAPDLLVKHHRDSAHLILLAQNNTGYQNLMKLSSIAFLEGMYYRPRIDYATLERYADGLICTSACLAGDIPQLLLKGKEEEAEALALRLKAIFGPERFYIELQDHGIEEQKRVLPKLIKLARKNDIPMVATNDIHYVNQEDATAQDVLLCIQTNALVKDENRMKMRANEMYVKSPAQMEELFSFVPEALSNTGKIAQMCQVILDFDTMHLPQFPVPEGKNDREYLKELCEKGMRAHGLAGRPEYEQRLSYELGVIDSMGFNSYFLIVWDFVDYAKRNGIPVGPGRGSAAGSLCSFCLNITTIDPIKYQLLFERFLNPERITMPDIDMDFCTKRRQEVIDYVIGKYGEDRVAQIITFNTMAARAAIKDVARALDIPYAEADKIAKMVPGAPGTTLEQALAQSKGLRELYENDSQTKHLIDLCRKLEGLPRHAGTHAAGVVIGAQPLTDFLPLQKNEDVVTTQFTMGNVEKLGLLKMDFLGLRNLNVIQNAVEMIRRVTGEEIDMDHLPMDDKKVYEMISSGDTDGVFQLESSGMTNFMKELRPGNFEDIIAGISLFRPGPMDSIPTYVACKRNPQKVRYLHPKLKPILENTYGCMVYQEQVMQIVQELAGYSLGRADLVRRAMAKKKADIMKKERQIFLFGDGKDVPGCIKGGVAKEIGEKIFDQMMDFAQYAFNRSHAAAYAVVAYQTAYLKCHHPKEFIAATINSYGGDNKKIAQYMGYCKREGIPFVSPDINLSRCEFTVNENGVVFGLHVIKNVGHNAALEIVREREKNGIYKSFYDFCRRTYKFINKRLLESLIKAGCFDSLGYTRSMVLRDHEKMLSDVAKQGALDGQVTLFDLSDEKLDIDVEPMEEMEKNLLLAYEKDTVGMYLSGHPMEKFSKKMAAMACNTKMLEEGAFREGDVVTIGGMITAKRNTTTKTNQIMAYLELEDLYNTVDIVVFPRYLQQFSPMMNEGAAVQITGKVNLREEEMPVILLEKIAPLQEKAGRVLQIKSEEYPQDWLAALARGTDEIELYFRQDGRWGKRRIGQIHLDDRVLEQAADQFGKEGIRIVEKH